MLTWGDLDEMVEGDPLVMRDRVWREIQELQAELTELRGPYGPGRCSCGGTLDKKSRHHTISACT